MPKRLHYELLILAGLGLSSCTDTQTDHRIARVEAEFGRVAAASSAMVDRMERAEARIEALERKIER